MEKVFRHIHQQGRVVLTVEPIGVPKAPDMYKLHWQRRISLRAIVVMIGNLADNYYHRTVLLQMK